MLPWRNRSYYCSPQGAVLYRDKQAGCISWLEVVSFFNKFRFRSICALPQSARDVPAPAWTGMATVPQGGPCLAWVTCGLSHRASVGQHSQSPLPPWPVLSPELCLQPFMADHFFQSQCELGHCVHSWLAEVQDLMDFVSEGCRPGWRNSWLAAWWIKASRSTSELLLLSAFSHLCTLQVQSSVPPPPKPITGPLPWPWLSLLHVPSHENLQEVLRGDFFL